MASDNSTSKCLIFLAQVLETQIFPKPPCSIPGEHIGQWQNRQEVAVMDLMRQMDTAEINDVAFWLAVSFPWK